MPIRATIRATDQLCIRLQTFQLCITVRPGTIDSNRVRRGLINTEIRSTSRIGNYWRGVAGKVNPRKAPLLSLPLALALALFLSLTRFSSQRTRKGRTRGKREAGEIKRRFPANRGGLEFINTTNVWGREPPNS